MASDVDLSSPTDGEPARPRAGRVPDAVWINQPPRAGRNVARAAKTAVAAAIVIGVLALAASERQFRPLELLPSALAGTEVEFAGVVADGPGHFPGQFDQRRLNPAEQPPTF